MASPFGEYEKAPEEKLLLQGLEYQHLQVKCFHIATSI
jgi:hypothetical protein